MDPIIVVDKIFLVYMLMLFARILGSWFPEFQQHPFFQFIAYYTDPYLNFFKRFIPPLGMMDLSPIVAFLSLKIIEEVVKGFVRALFL